MKTWKTTLAGIFTAAALLFGQAGNFLDGDPGTMIDITMVIAALSALWGFIKAKDSGDEGNIPPPKPERVRVAR